MQMWKKTSRWHAREKKRAARGAHEEFPKKTLRDKERTKKKKKRQEEEEEEEEEEETAARGTRASDGRNLCGGTEGRRKSGKRCIRGIV